ncbi:bacterial Ig-like domain-containing protein [Listeria monocytogenes]|nr:isopeptide-forming domain-containing fimbrial protein [Listeria monocytogenes]EAD0532569.1 isopeptide-forming domain-containing fimbrial protein [Listeria monocytogenes]EAE6409785.1 isopeptide-forming domain-containing fimbrial protein [Listeria monocytogenes]EAK9081353.1 isopeptide-forming domain-containing fimbrial protein [Listeria monocytogenes]EDP7576267.1 isopeptide-forming domain-containing fimbrial protein [Listeria monocytogenes]
MKLKSVMTLLLLCAAVTTLLGVHALLAAYNVVDDLTIETISVSPIKENETVTFTVSDSNEDSKVVIPLADSTEYIESDNKAGSVLLDQLNHQIVIDWFDKLDSQKSVTITVKFTQAGDYSFQAMTIREEQQVASKNRDISVIKVDENSENDATSDELDASSDQGTDTSEVNGVDLHANAKNPFFEMPDTLPDTPEQYITVTQQTVDSQLSFEWLTFVDLTQNSSQVAVGRVVETFQGNTQFKDVSLTFNPKADSQESLNVKDSTIYSSKSQSYWNPKDNFISATDDQGNALDISHITVNGIVNTKIPGDYLVTYSYGNIHKEVKITVKKNHSSIETKKIMLLEGDYWDPMSNLVKVTDEEGQEVPFDDPRITYIDDVDTDFDTEFQASAYCHVTYTYTSDNKNGYVEPVSKRELVKVIGKRHPDGKIEGSSNVKNKTHHDGEYYVHDNVTVSNQVIHDGNIWNETIVTKIPDGIDIDESSGKGKMVTEYGDTVEMTNDFFVFDDKAKTVSIVFTQIAGLPPDEEGGYSTGVKYTLTYEFDGTINRMGLKKELPIVTKINFYNNLLEECPQVILDTHTGLINAITPEMSVTGEYDNLSQSKETTSIGDQLQYTFSVNNKVVGSEIDRFTILDELPSSLEFIPSSIEFVRKDGSVLSIGDEAYDEEAHTISATFNETFHEDEDISLRFKARIKDSALGNRIENSAIISGKDLNDTPFNVKSNIVSTGIIYSGDLEFGEIPKTLSFKDSFISIGTTTIERKEENWKIMVQDTRAKKESWHITVKQTTPFESVDGDQLSQVLIYKKAGQDDQFIDTQNAIEIFRDEELDEKEYEVSWPKDQGFFLKVPPGLAKAKQYQTELQWNLTDTPV